MQYLYLLIFPKKSCFKIGKAKNIYERSQAFDWLGDISYSESYSLKLTDDRIPQLERGLHLLLKPNQVFKGYGDGATELFSIESLDRAIEFIKLIPDYYSDLLQKGISPNRVKTKITTKQIKKLDDAKSFLKDYQRCLNVLSSLSSLNYKATHDQENHEILLEVTNKDWDLYEQKMLNKFSMKSILHVLQLNLKKSSHNIIVSYESDDRTIQLRLIYGVFLMNHISSIDVRFKNLAQKVLYLYDRRQAILSV